MPEDAFNRLRSLQGHRVGVTLKDGSRIDDAEVVSACSDRVHSVWLSTEGVDAFVPLTDIVDVWEVLPPGKHRVN